MPNIAAGIGAVATQALSNPFYGVNGISCCTKASPRDEVVKALTAADDGREHRQLHVMDAAGRATRRIPARPASTGAATRWRRLLGRRQHAGGPAVIAETAQAYAANRAMPFARRLVAALQAGEAAGGDKRGKQSAALLIYGEEEWPDLDLRVDDHTDPLAELERLEAVSRERWVHFAKFMPTEQPAATSIGRRSTARRLDAAEGIAKAPAGRVRSRSARCGRDARSGDRKPACRVPRRPRAAHGRGRRRRPSLARGSTLGLVGESGCGKSVTSLAVMGLLPKAAAEVTGGGDLRRRATCSTCPTARLRDLRGDRMAMIFQEPMTSLNPSYTIGEQIVEVLVRHRGRREPGARQARSRCSSAPASRRRPSASTTIRTSSPAACASAP